MESRKVLKATLMCILAVFFIISLYFSYIYLKDNSTGLKKVIMTDPPQEVIARKSLIHENVSGKVIEISGDIVKIEKYTDKSIVEIKIDSKTAFSKSNDKKEIIEAAKNEVKKGVDANVSFMINYDRTFTAEMVQIR